MTVEEMLRNWARWATATDDCFPQGYPPECSVERIALPYKVMLTEDEALEEMERHQEPDRIWAERAERWVHMLETPERIAIQTHWIHWPESMGRAWELTADQLTERRARRVARLTGTRVDADEYGRLLGSAYAELREALANV